MTSKLQISKITQETPDAITICLKQPFLKKIAYQAGQFVIVNLSIDGQEVERCYSLSSVYKIDKTLNLTVKRTPNGLVSNYLNDHAKHFKSLLITNPTGFFTFNPEPGDERTLVLFGAGSGITPLFSILKQVLYSESKRKVYLFYANRNREAIIFDTELLKLKTKFAERLHIEHILEEPPPNWEGKRGLLDVDSVQNMLHKSNVSADSFYYICGPEGFMDKVQAGLENYQVRAEDVKIERFKMTNPALQVTGEGAKNVTVYLRNQPHTVEVQDGESILDAALNQGLDMPYSCQSGVCATCMGQIKNGEVHMEENNALSDEEVNQGQVLLCTAVPKTDDVEVEVD